MAKEKKSWLRKLGEFLFEPVFIGEVKNADEAVKIIKAYKEGNAEPKKEVHQHIHFHSVKDEKGLHEMIEEQNKQNIKEEDKVN